MFWGLIMEPGRCYTQKVKISFHVSKAALDISNSGNEPAQVMCVFEGRNYLLCTLNKQDKVQCTLDLNFEAGSKVSFATNGKAHVHLTGYLINTEEDDLFEDDADEEVEEEEANVLKKDKKRLVKESTEGPPNKKTKIAKNSLANVEAEEEEDSSDSDFDIDQLLKKNEGEEASEDDDEEEEEEEDEEDEDASSLSGEEVEVESEEEKEGKPKQNGLANTKTNLKQKKNKEQKPQEKVPKGKPVKQEEKKQQKPKKAVLKSGVLIEDLREGSGDTVKEGKFVSVYYEGRLKNNNKLFDATTKGPGFRFRLGKGEVIKGWDIGVVGMKVGGKRRIICPAKVAYGATGSPPVIPPNATLIFDVELKKIG